MGGPYVDAEGLVAMEEIDDAEDVILRVSKTRANTGGGDQGPAGDGEQGGIGTPLEQVRAPLVVGVGVVGRVFVSEGLTGQ